MRFIARLKTAAIAMSLVGGLAQPVAAGGWGVTTIDEMPQTIVAGDKIEIRLAVRQHGVRLMDGIEPVLAFANGKDRIEVKAQPISRDKKDVGHYVATIVFPKAGEWQWEMTSFPPQRMMPVQVIEPAQRLRVLRSARLATATPAGQVALGKALFMSKGCFVCHAHSAIAQSGIFRNAYPFGNAPDLTQRGLSATYLQTWLKNPQAVKPQTQMPNFGLKDVEIRALAAFLTAK